MTGLPEPAPPHDPRVVERLLAENLDGLQAFLRLRAGPAIRARMGHSDLVQSVCREVLESAEGFSFQGDGAFRSWLYTAALRKLVEKDRRLHAERRDVRREVPVDADGGADAAALRGYADVAGARECQRSVVGSGKPQRRCEQAGRGGSQQRWSMKVRHHLGARCSDGRHDAAVTPGCI